MATAAGSSRYEPAKLGVVLLDMDGLLLDSEVLALRAWYQTAEKLGVPPNRRMFRRSVGYADAEFLPLLTEAWADQLLASEFLKRAGASFEQLLLLEAPQLKPGAEALLGVLDALRLRRAVVTSTIAKRAKMMLERVGIQSRIDFIVTREDVTAGKPSPEGYLTALKRFGVSPAEGIALEDSLPGVLAATSAGLRTLMVPSIPFQTGVIHGHTIGPLKDLFAAAQCVQNLFIGNDRDN